MKRLVLAIALAAAAVGTAGSPAVADDRTNTACVLLPTGEHDWLCVWRPTSL